MKRSKFTEEQIIAILREQEAGAKTAEVCRRHGISSATFYAWKAKFGGMEPSEAKRLKALEDENAKLTGFKTCCDITDAHDPSRGRNAAPPPPDDLLKHIDQLKDWDESLRLRQKAIS